MKVLQITWRLFFASASIIISCSCALASVNDAALFNELKIFGFNMTINVNISLSLDLPYWGQDFSEIQSVCKNWTAEKYNTCSADAVSYLCKNGGAAYKNLQPCFSNNATAGFFGMCKKWRSEALEMRNTVKTSQSFNCNIANIYKACAINILDGVEECGKNASDWFENWWMRINCNYTESSACSNSTDEDDSSKSNDGSDEWSIILGIVLAVTACLLVVGIIVFVIFLFSRRKLQSDDGPEGEPGQPRGRRGFGQRREVPPPYALVVNVPGDGSSGDGNPSDPTTTTMRLVDRDNRAAAETQARLYDGNATNTTGNGLILPPPYQNVEPPPDIFGTMTELAMRQDSDKEEELTSVSTSTTQCSSINLQAIDSVSDVGATTAATSSGSATDRFNTSLSSTSSDVSDTTQKSRDARHKSRARSPISNGAQNFALSPSSNRDIHSEQPDVTITGHKQSSGPTTSSNLPSFTDSINGIDLDSTFCSSV